MSAFANVAAEVALLFPLVSAAGTLSLAFLWVFCREGRRRTAAAPGRLPRVAVVVPARNEELLLPSALAALAAASARPGQPFQIHVVSDGSTDGTARVAREATGGRATVHELPRSLGKSGALEHVLDRVDADYLCVIDADTVAEPDAVERLVRACEQSGAAAATGSPRVRNLRGVLARMQAMEYFGIIGLAKRAESVFGALFTVTGACACYRIAAVRAAGGFASPSVTEDIELSWRLQRQGFRLVYEPAAIFHVQAPPDWRALYRQRVRWARGAVEVLRLHGDVRRLRNLALVPILCQSLLTGGWALATAAGLLASLWQPAAGVPWSGIALLGSTAFAAQTLAAWVFDGHYTRGMLRLVPWALLYPLYYWLVILPCFFAGAAAGLAPRLPERATWQRTARAVT